MHKTLLGFLLAAATLTPGVKRPFDTWRSYGGGVDSSQYSSLKQINKSNVAQLQVAWIFQNGGSPMTNPLVADNVIYLPRASGPETAIVALDAATGKELWSSPGGTTSRGMNYWESADRSDRRLVFTSGGFIKEINARTGTVIYSFGDEGKVDPTKDSDRLVGRITGNPGRIYKDTIIVALPANGASYDSTPGYIRAYDVVTGKLKWTFHSVPRPDEFGADTWPQEALRVMPGGVHDWSEMTADEENGIVFIPFGTARYDFYGANRKGDDLFGNCIVALDANTGKRIWHFQTVHHDLWDYDLPTAPKLLTVRHDGRNVDVVVQATKQGFLFVFERKTGKPLWPIAERPVPQSDVPGEFSSPTQPFPTAPPPFARQSFTEKDINPYMTEEQKEGVRKLLSESRNEGLYTPPSLRGTIQLPGHNGGANWGSSAVDPAKGTMYVLSKELVTYLKLVEPGARGNAGAAGAAAAPGGRPVAGPRANRTEGMVEYGSPVNFMLTGSTPDGVSGLNIMSPPWSQLTAFDLNTGKILWHVPHGSVPALGDKGKDIGGIAPRGGVVVTGGGLVFVGSTSDRKLRAYDQDTGKVLWAYDLPAPQEGVPAVYQVGGREYIAVAVGGPGLFQPKPSASNPIPKAGPGQYMVFSLPVE
jgi:glucose dehydrogenase